MYKKQQKAFDVKNLSEKQLQPYLKKTGYLSKKYDGYQVSIIKHNHELYFYSSNGKEFYLPELEASLLTTPGNFTLWCEFIYGEGLLGQRNKASYLMTLVTEYKKGINSKLPTKYKFKVFDVTTDKDQTFSERLLNPVPAHNKLIERVNYEEVTLEKALTYDVPEGLEGYIWTSADNVYKYGKRVRESYKLKTRPEGTATILKSYTGTGKYYGMVGGLKVKDKKGHVFCLGSGLTDEQRALPESYFIGKDIEFNYERFQEQYIQPTIKRILN